MSDPFLPEVPNAPESGADEDGEVEDPAEPDVLPGTAHADPEGAADAAEADGPQGFRAPEAGDRLDAAELREDLREE